MTLDDRLARLREAEAAEVSSENLVNRFRVTRSPERLRDSFLRSKKRLPILTSIAVIILVIGAYGLTSKLSVHETCPTIGESGKDGEGPRDSNGQLATSQNERKQRSVIPRMPDEPSLVDRFIHDIILTNDPMGKSHFQFPEEIQALIENPEFQMWLSEMMTAYGDELVPSLKRALAVLKAPRHRAFLFAVLAAVGGAEAETELISCLTSTESDIEFWAAAYGLGWIGSPRALDGLLSIGRENQMVNSMPYMAALGRFGMKAFDEIAALVQGRGPESYISYHYLIVDSSEAHNTIAAGLIESDPIRKSYLLFAGALAGGDETVDELLRILEGNKDDKVTRGMILYALRVLAEDDKLSSQTIQKVEAFLEPLVVGAGSDFSQAIMVSAEFATPRSLELLERVYESSDSSRRKAILLQLGRAGAAGQSVLARILTRDGFDSGQLRMRTGAVRKVEDGAFTELLIHLQADPSTDIADRFWALELISTVQDAQTKTIGLDELVNIYTGPELPTPLRFQAIDVMGKFAPESADTLIDIATHADEMTLRMAAYRALITKPKLARSDLVKSRLRELSKSILSEMIVAETGELKGDAWYHYAKRGGFAPDDFVMKNLFIHGLDKGEAEVLQGLSNRILVPEHVGSPEMWQVGIGIIVDRAVTEALDVFGANLQWDN